MDRIAAATSALVFGCAAVLYGTTTTRSITLRFGGVDGGELAATALSGGVAHPSGYPVYLILARFALLLPWGEPAARLAYLSAIAGAGAAALATASIMLGSTTDQISQPTWWRVIAGVAGGLLLATTTRMWSQAVIVEVYALHMLWLTLCACCFLGWLRTARPAWLIVAGLWWGLGLGTHLTIAAMLPAAALAWVATPRRPTLTSTQALCAGVSLCVGLAPYALLPVWAAREAVPSWGDLGSIGGVWAHISGAEYGYLVGVVPWAQRLDRISYAVRDLLSQPGPVALVLALWWGLPYGWRHDRALVMLLGMVALTSLIFAVGYGGADGTVYLLPWTWAWCVWAGLGVFGSMDWIASALRRKQAVPSLAALLLIAVLWPLGSRYSELDLSQDTTERDRILAVLNALPADAIMVSTDDANTFGVWYAQRALDLRSNVVVVDARLITRAWYAQQLRRQLQLDPTTPFCTALQQSDRPWYVALRGGVQRVVDRATVLRSACPAELQVQ